MRRSDTNSSAFTNSERDAMRKTKFAVTTLGLLGLMFVCVCRPVSAQDQNAQMVEADRLFKKVDELHSAGRYAEAIPLAERVLAIYEKTVGPEHPSSAGPLYTLGELSRLQGDYARAEPLLLRTLAIQEKAIPGKPLVGDTHVSLGLLYRDRGDFNRAALYLMRALEIHKKEYGMEHLDVASDMEHLGTVFFTVKRFNEAGLLFARSLEIRKKKLKADDPSIGASLSNLAMYLLYIQGDFHRAEALFKRAYEIFKKAYGAGHPQVAGAINNLAFIEQIKGDFSRAAPLLQRSMEIYTQTLGPDHPEVATKLNDLAGLYAGKGDYEQAVRFKQRADEARERNIIAILKGGSQEQKQFYLYTIISETDGSVSMHTVDAPRSADAARLAFTVILQRKGRALDVMSDQITALRRRAAPEDQKLLDELANTRSRLATLQLSNMDNLVPAAQSAEVARLGVEQERLESNISRRNAEFRVIAQPISLDTVRQALPPDSALVELFIYRPYNTRSPKQPDGVPHYVAYILRPQDAAPQWVELGDAPSIDERVGELRAALRNRGRQDFKKLARELDERVMRPVRRLLGPMRRIFLAPDGMLNLIPFGALVDENGLHLIESYSFNYLTSGRDLLRLQFTSESRETPMVFADPTYDLPATARPNAGRQSVAPAASNTNNLRSQDFTSGPYNPLPGTAEEASALSQLFPDATVLLQEQATEGAVKKVNRPRLLHIATHGFFLTDQAMPTAGQSRGFGGDAGNDIEKYLAENRENPLLRSGLIFAGVKQRASGPGEDGVLTALEVAGLNLWGTKLVVLSACETGLGDVKNREGVYGLRRALVLTGSETQVISLWKVNDAGTRDLMKAYYTRLQRGEGRIEALRQVQLEMLHGQFSPTGSSVNRETTDVGEKDAIKNYRHPYYWAAFIPSGDWRSMSGK